MGKELSKKAQENNQINNEIHERIRKWLIEHDGISPRTPETKIAERLDCEYVIYAKQISAGKAISLQELTSYAEILGCSTDYLLGISSEDNTNVKHKEIELEDCVRAILYYDALTPNSCPVSTSIEIKEYEPGESSRFTIYPTVSFTHTGEYFYSRGSSGDLGDLFLEYDKMSGAFEYLTNEQILKLINDLINKYFYPLPFK